MKFYFLSFIILISLTLYAQEKEYAVERSTPSLRISSENKFGKPLINKVEEGLRIKVWFMTQDQHETNATLIQSETKLEDKAKEQLIQGTHYVLVNVTDSKTKKIMTDAEVWFHIMYPNKKNLMPRLVKVDDHFASGVDLSPKGKYTFMVHVNMEQKQPAITFKYDLK